MKTLKEEIFLRTRRILMLIITPIVLFALFVSALLLYTLFTSQMREIEVKTNEYTRELEFVMDKVKIKYNPTIKELLL
ncbi:MAG TPA: hypothetical protein PK466_14835 [Thermotogota bacterium]|nr:hypothetical protein [Thermotogota bacterium]